MTIARYITIFAIGVGLMLCPVSLIAEPLIVSFGTQNGPPKVVIKDSRLVGGIVKNIMDEVAEELGIAVVYQMVPKNREEHFFHVGRIHMIVLHNPQWISDNTPIDWSIPLFEDADVFVVSAKRPFSITRFEDLRGKRLGTMLGFFYPPELTAMFEQGDVSREDVTDLEQNFIKLDLGRIDALIDSRLMVAYYIKIRNAHQRFVIAEKVADTIALRSALSKKAPITIDRLNTVYRRMKESGTLARILDRYR